MRTINLITRRIFLIALAVLLPLTAMAGCSHPVAEGFVMVTAGNNCTVALKSDGTVWAWGNLIELGFYDKQPVNTHNKPIQISGIDNAIAFAVGEMHFVVLKSDGTVWAQGRNNQGQLGYGTYY